MFSAIEESAVIDSNCDFTTDPPKHHYLNDTIELNNVSGDLVHPACIDIDIALDSHQEPTVRHDLHPFDKSVDHRVKRLKTRRLLNREKNLPTYGWRLSDIGKEELRRLSDIEFAKLNNLYNFTVEGCCDPSGLNRHCKLPYYSEHNSLLDNDVSGESIYCNPPCSLAVACVQHFNSCHAKAPMDTTSVIVLPHWFVYKAITKELNC